MKLYLNGASMPTELQELFYGGAWPAGRPGPALRDPEPEFWELPDLLTSGQCHLCVPGENIGPQLQVTRLRFWWLNLLGDLGVSGFEVMDVSSFFSFCDLTAVFAVQTFGISRP